MAHIRGVSSYLKRSGLEVWVLNLRPRLEVDLPTPNNSIKKKYPLIGVPRHFEDLVNSQCSQVGNQKQSSQLGFLLL